MTLTPVLYQIISAREEGVTGSLTSDINIVSICVGVCVPVYMYVRVCVCVCACQDDKGADRGIIYRYICYICKYMN